MGLEHDGGLACWSETSFRNVDATQVAPHYQEQMAKCLSHWILAHCHRMADHPVAPAAFASFVKDM